MKRIFALILGAFLLAGWISPVLAASSQPVVQVVFFFAPTWSNYQQIITGDLPPLRAKYGAQLEISMLDVSTDKGQAVYLAAVQKYNISTDRQQAPTLIIGSTALVGPQEIAAQLPGLVDKAVKAGGSPMPDIPGLQDALAVDATNFGANSTDAAAPNNNSLANNLAQGLLVGMVAVVGLEIYRQPWKNYRKSHSKRPQRDWLAWVIPTLVLVGLVISIYLSYVELTATTAVCGPVGDCNAVQTSPYARLFGILPIGVLGVFGNLAIVTAWAVKHFGPHAMAHRASLALVALVSFGILFSIYLTFLEPYVIGATCAWCLGSALVMTGLFLTGFETAWK
jgi:uncharacterized membrane protein